MRTYADIINSSNPVLETESPPKPVEAPPKEDDELGERIKRIIREIPDPTPQPGGE